MFSGGRDAHEAAAIFNCATSLAALVMACVNSVIARRVCPARARGITFLPSIPTLAHLYRPLEKPPKQNRINPKCFLTEHIT